MIGAGETREVSWKGNLETRRDNSQCVMKVYVVVFYVRLKIKSGNRNTVTFFVQCSDCAFTLVAVQHIGFYLITFFFKMLIIQRAFKKI